MSRRRRDSDTSDRDVFEREIMDVIRNDIHRDSSAIHCYHDDQGHFLAFGYDTPTGVNEAYQRFLRGHQLRFDQRASQRRQVVQRSRRYNLPSGRRFYHAEVERSDIDRRDDDEDEVDFVQRTSATGSLVIGLRTEQPPSLSRLDSPDHSTSSRSPRDTRNPDRRHRVSRPLPRRRHRRGAPTSSDSEDYEIIRPTRRPRRNRSPPPPPPQQRTHTHTRRRRNALASPTQPLTFVENYLARQPLPQWTEPAPQAGSGYTRRPRSPSPPRPRPTAPQPQAQAQAQGQTTQPAEDEAECVVCREPLSVDPRTGRSDRNPTTVTTPCCRQPFHRHCLATWFTEGQENCPYCRHDFGIQYVRSIIGGGD